MAEEGYKVSLNVYDLSQGLARQLSSTFLGKVIEAIWHTGIVVYGNEYYFGGGIQHAPVGTTPYGTPVRVVDLGTTHVPKELFEDYLQEISPRYTSETYSLLTHNCNNFSNEVAQFLVGNTIPDYILELPNDVMSSPMGSLILPMIQRLETTLRAGAAPQPLQFKPPSALPQQPITHSKATTRTNPSTEQPTKSNPSANLTPIKEAQQESKPSSSEPVKVGGGAEDPLGTARSKVQEEISNEFAALMATGSLRASEAAALAARRVMERYGQMNIVVPQS